MKKETIVVASSNKGKINNKMFLNLIVFLHYFIISLINFVNEAIYSSL